MKEVKASLLLIVLLMLSALIAAESNAEESKSDGEVNTGQDFSRPLDRLDLRWQPRQLDGDTMEYITTFRLDEPIPLNEGKDGILYLRGDGPIIRSNAVSSDNPNGDYETGFGDLLAQAIYIFPKDTCLPFGMDAAGIGSQLIFPTASQDLMGAEKYQIVPTLGGKWNMPSISKGSFFTGLLRYQQSFADVGGGDKRDDVSELAFAPGLYIHTGKSAWDWPIDFINFYATYDMRFNFTDGKTKKKGDMFIPFDIMLGKMLNESTVASVEFAAPIYKDDSYDLYDWLIEVRLGFFF